MFDFAAAAAARVRFAMKTFSAAGRSLTGTTPAMQWIAVPPMATT